MAGHITKERFRDKPRRHCKPGLKHSKVVLVKYIDDGLDQIPDRCPLFPVLMRRLLLLGRALWLLLLLLILHLLLSLLQLLKDLLRAAGDSGRPLLAGGTVNQRRLRRLFFRLRLLRRFVVLRILLRTVGSGGVITGAARAQDDLPRRSRTLVADHQHVIAGAIQQL